MIITICAILATITAFYFIQFKTPYKVKHWIWSVVFFCNMFGAKCGNFNDVSVLFNAFVFWFCLVAGVWHLTKAYFFIEGEETKGDKI